MGKAYLKGEKKGGKDKSIMKRGREKQAGCGDDMKGSREEGGGGGWVSMPTITDRGQGLDLGLDLRLVLGLGSVTAPEPGLEDCSKHSGHRSSDVHNTPPPLLLLVLLTLPLLLLSAPLLL